MTMTLVSTVTVGAGGAASIDFTSIPQTGTDLLIVVSGRTTDANVSASSNIKFNGSATGYSEKTLRGTGSGTDTNSTSNLSALLYSFYFPGSSATSNTFGNNVLYIPNYAGSTNKSTSADHVTENNATAAALGIVAGLWANTAAITQVTITANFAQYSTASLYTITKGSGGATVS